MGHVSSEEAFAPILARAATRAAFMRILPLSFSERITLFQEWINPCSFSLPGPIVPLTRTALSADWDVMGVAWVVCDSLWNASSAPWVGVS